MVKKILCLHGGGQNGNSFRSMNGMQDLINQLPENDNYQFFFADAENSLWIRDPPGGKGNPTQDPNWANSSISYLSNYISDHGPFYGILGYSQGVPMTLLMLASGFRFEKVFLFCGYLPKTHTGLMSLIDSTSPFPYKTLIFIGNLDYDFKSLGLEIKNYFTNYTELIGTNTGHELPIDNHDGFDQVVDFARSSGTVTTLSIQSGWNLITVTNDSMFVSEDISKIESIYTFGNDLKMYNNLLALSKNNILLDKTKGYWILLKSGNTEIRVTEIN